MWEATSFNLTISLLGWAPGLLAVLLAFGGADVFGALCIYVQFLFFFVAMIAATAVQHLESIGSPKAHDAGTIAAITAATFALPVVLYIGLAGFVSFA